MRRSRVILLVALGLLHGCADGATQPPPLAAVYHLVSVDGRPLPVVIDTVFRSDRSASGMLACVRELAASTLTLPDPPSTVRVYWRDSLHVRCPDGRPMEAWDVTRPGHGADAGRLFPITLFLGRLDPPLVLEVYGRQSRDTLWVERRETVSGGVREQLDWTPLEFLATAPERAP